ncbi:ABC transporter ATP-binding protein [Thiocapsa bogorovii]|uniref:ABC transporter ATP-binding protein n=1 Tax=Thiocapsa bogorovii TaxID=521689 RepID=UPI001E524897|nr:ATP-binding cassette domain-containing protein [Thiocapsa bogorovii]UHD15873.1 ATP-binding cassette domain-containing protein [Thiocapsa bogorovii]
MGPRMAPVDAVPVRAIPSDPPDSATAAPLIEATGLGYRYGHGRGAFEVSVPSLRITRGETLAITGESGSGKSTVLELLGLAAPPLAGAGFLWHAAAPVDIAALWRARAEGALAQMRARSIGFVMQTGGLLPFLTVRENIGINRRLLGLPADDARIAHLVAALEIGALLDRRPAQLSVGQQQRVSIGRALAHGPALVLADEPSSALDPRLADRVLGLLRDLAVESGAAVVVATHEQARVRALGLREIRARPLDAPDRLGSCFEDAP